MLQKKIKMKEAQKSSLIAITQVHFQQLRCNPKIDIAPNIGMESKKEIFKIFS